MSMVERVSSLLMDEGEKSEPVGTIHIVDLSSLNWLYITYNTVEELVRTDPNATPTLWERAPRTCEEHHEATSEEERPEEGLADEYEGIAMVVEKVA